MPTYIGKEARGKIIKVRPYESEGVTKLLWLSERQRGLMLALSEYLDWSTRWETLPSPLDDDDYRDAYVSQLKSRLMEEIEFCAEVINCINTDEDTKRTLSEFVNQSVGQALDERLGQELSIEELTRPIAPIGGETCDYVKLGRQCSALIRFFDKGNIDFLQKLAVAANSIELAQQIANLPFINLVTRQTGINSALEFVDYMVEAIKEQYEAGQSDEYMDMLARRLFCLCYLDCTITLERFFQMTAERANEHIPENVTEAISTLVDILEIFTGLDVVGTDTVDIMYWLDGVLAKVVSVLSFRLADRALDFMLNSAANDASFDLDLSELECPVPGTPVIITEGWEDFNQYGGTNVVQDGDYWEINATTDIDGSKVITFEQDGGGVFFLEDISFPDGVNASVHVWEDTDNGYHVEGSTTGIEFTDMLKYGLDWSSLVSLPQRIRFKIWTYGVPPGILP